jgi:hypothetical protein
MPLNHLDRIVISPTELMHVAATKPHELTHQFKMSGDANYRRLAYTANWLDNPDGTALQPGTTTLLFRALDFLRAGPFAEGIPTGGRIAGKVNLNTIHNNLSANQLADQFNAVADPPAVTDPQPANRFTAVDVFNAWQGIVNGQGGQYQNPRVAGGLPFLDGNDKYLKGSAVDVALPSGQPGTVSDGGQDRTLARRGGLWRPAQAAQLHDEDYAPANKNLGAMAKYELMSKTYQQFTTRSNAFAVYATIGYFEVVNDGPYDETNRPILGKELGTDEGTITRNKFFAVIDRTNLSVEPLTPQNPTSPRQGPRPVYFTYEPAVSLANGIPAGNYAVVPDPDLTPPNQPPLSQVQCRIPGSSQILGPSPPYPQNKTISLSGSYDGAQWTIVDYTPASNKGPVTFAVLDTGPKAELVQILIPQMANGQPALDNYGAATIILQAVGTQANPGKFQYRHARGASLRLLTTDPNDGSFIPLVSPFNLGTATWPGNPGPQAGFNYHSNRYAPVVRYAEQLR